VLDSLPPGNTELSDEDPNKFIALIGGEAIKELSERTDIEALSLDLRVQHAKRHRSSSVRTRSSVSARSKLSVRTRISQENRPWWMVMNVIPVIPPELRPLVPLRRWTFCDVRS